MRKNLLSGAAIAVLGMGFVSSAMAEDINVSTVAALHDAVSAAQNGDVIKIAAGTYLLDSEIDVTGKNISLVGTGKVVLDGQKKVRVMNVHANANAVVENLIIQNGYVSDGGNNKGGGIRVDGGSLTVTNCKFIDNTVDYQASSGNWTGGAGIHSNNAKLTVTNTEFKGGTAYQGGAMTLQNSDIDAKYVLFEGNRTLFEGKKDESKGGAICVRTDNGDVHTHNFENCVFKENKSWGNGGAMSYNVSGGAAGQNTIFRGCSFIRNTTNIDLDNLERNADNNGLRGGALFMDTDGKLKAYFLSCTIAQNVAAQGGGAIAIPTLKSKPEAEVRFVNCTITGNHNLDNSGNGAGLWMHEISNCGGVKIVNTILTGNWSIKVNDETYAADAEVGEAWKHWEYSDLITTASTKQELFELSNTVIGYLTNAEKFTGEYHNLTIQRQEGQAWVEGETEENQLGELAAYDEAYFAYPFSISAMTWLDGELGDMDLAKEYDCPTDQFGIEWETNCIGAVQYDDIENYDQPVFFNEDKLTDGIRGVKNDVKTADNAFYTLGGVRVARPTAKGIYIHNGKKVVK